MLLIAFLAIASEGVLCALPCSTALTHPTSDASPTGHCETNPVQPVAGLTLAAVPGFCGEHANIISPSERASNRVAFLDASTLQTVSSAADEGGGIRGSNLRIEVHGSPPNLSPPLRI
ncbi:MAG: hypothetical protein WEB50_01990 [Vicinamibacterales bacterium]